MSGSRTYLLLSFGQRAKRKGCGMSEREEYSKVLDLFSTVQLGGSDFLRFLRNSEDFLG